MGTSKWNTTEKHTYINSYSDKCTFMTICKHGSGFEPATSSLKVQSWKVKGAWNKASISASKIYLLFPVNLEIFDALSVLREAPLPDGVTRAPGRCQSTRTAPAHYTAYNLNENATFHQLAAGMFYNTFPEDFSILSVVRLPGIVLFLAYNYPSPKLSLFRFLMIGIKFSFDV